MLYHKRRKINLIITVIVDLNLGYSEACKIDIVIRQNGNDTEIPLSDLTLS